ncbi:MAG: Spy/CpxP family protein refolding chaperone [Pseudomonadota bacterium]
MKWTAALLLSAVLALPAAAAPDCKTGIARQAAGAPLASPRFKNMLVKRLDLTPEQTDTLAAMRAQHRDSMRSLADQYKPTLCEFYLDTQPDDPAYASKAAEAGQAAAALAAGAVELTAQWRTEFQAILTAEQKAKWIDVKADIAEKMSERRGRRGKRQQSE